MVDDVGGSDVFGDENNGGFSWINNWIKGTWVEEVEHYLHYVGGGAGALALTGVAAVSALYLASRPTGEEPLVPLEQQCKIVGGSENIHVSRFCKEAEEGKYISYIDEDTRTLYDTFRKGAKVSNNGPCLGWRETTTSPYTWLNYNETLLRARNFGSGLVGLGLNPGPETLIGVYAQNCPEWILTEQGAYCYGMVIVPLYDTLGPEACAFIIKQAEISVVICEDDRKAGLLLDRSPRCLKRLVTIKDVRPATTQRAKNLGMEILRFEDVEKTGAVLGHKEQPPKPSYVFRTTYFVHEHGQNEFYHGQNNY
ncbi:long-chain-fatty-acid--CoA ligase 1-like [Ctenocephalides felis]|uniref:long-chain-fatty-acid--CoA ligase 1-like n=1 Tax=Ctenocephalides felis TaxID=7515 RepID=UPI000E6E1398|nr:long-chain-fatty-acid--CoA ligase 1-like [Ctenocephalides felis]